MNDWGEAVRPQRDLNYTLEVIMTKRTQRRDPVEYTNILLKETKFSCKEIADLCGLDIYEVTAIKLKSRVS